MGDREIIDLLFNREERGLLEAEMLYKSRLLRIAEGLLSKEDAEECVNDVFLALWNHIPPARPDKLFPYMVQSLKNLAKNRWKAEQTQKRHAEIIELSDELAACIPDPTANTEEEAILAASNALSLFLKKQSRMKRDMFVLRYWYGKSIGEIASLFGFSFSKTAKLLERMKEELKKKVRS